MKIVSLTLVALLALSGCKTILTSKRPILDNSACGITQDGYLKRVQGFNTSGGLTEKNLRELDSLLDSARPKISTETDQLFLDTFQGYIKKLLSGELTFRADTFEQDVFGDLVKKMESGEISEAEGELTGKKFEAEMNVFFYAFSAEVNKNARGWEYIGFSYETTSDCQRNVLTVDPKTLEPKQYAEMKDKVIPFKIYKFQEFEHTIWLRQSHYRNEGEYQYDYFFPVGENQFKVYRITDHEGLVMAIYGHAYYDDFQPITSMENMDNPFAGLASEGFSFERVSGELDVREYPQLFRVDTREAALDFRPAWQRRIKPQYEDVTTVLPMTPDRLRQVAFMLNEIEVGRLPYTKAMSGDIRVELYEFTPAQ